MGRKRIEHPFLAAREWEVLQSARHAWSLVSNGNFLPSPSRQKAARDLVEKGYLTKSENQPRPGNGWLIVVLTKANVRRYNAALKKAREKTNA